MTDAANGHNAAAQDDVDRAATQDDINRAITPVGIERAAAQDDVDRVETQDDLNRAETQPVSIESGEDRDYSDPAGYELMLDDNPDDDTRLQNAQKRLISIDISNQQGVHRYGNRIVLPGRVSLMLVTLTQMLFSVIALSGGFVHFSAISPNYLFPFAVLQLIMFLQIGLYHSSYRAQRTAMCALVTFATIGIMSYIDWAFIDLIIYPKKPGTPDKMLWMAMIGFTCIPTLMLLHLVFLGRGTRTIGIREVRDNVPRKTRVMVPVAVVRRDGPESQMPTEIMEGPDVQRKTE